MDPMAIVGMIFTLVMLVVIGGFILLIPLSRQLAAFLRLRLERSDKADQDARIASLTRAVASLRDDIERLAERQEFTEHLLERPRTTDAEEQ